MKQMGIKQEEIPASKVTIEKEDGSKIIINNPSVQKINMQGNDSFQIAGDVSEEESGIAGSFNEEDVKTVMERAGVSEDKAKEALTESNGNLAEAILTLKQ